MNLRPATMADAKILFAWRNDPETRANSMTTGEVPWENHCIWLQGSIASPKRDLLVAEVEGDPVGTVRIDRDEETEMSWTLSPEHRGRGLCKMMVKQACPEGPVIARIKSTNIASQKIAEVAGFKLVESGELQLWKRS